jgi:CubicO group peptidase (beta-lactamase class C family)
LDHAAARRLGWDSCGLDAVFSYASTLSTDTLLIVSGNEIVGSFGNLTSPYRTHLMRKAFLSAFIGLHVGSAKNQIRLNATLLELAIDDEPGPLTALQKQTTVKNLLNRKSGINHRAAADGGLIADNVRRLGGRENISGTIWAYNNWNYNALTTIFETRTGLAVAEAFNTGIAQPAQMKDYVNDNVTYISETYLSQHRSALFRMSARDLATFGRIFLHGGRAGRRAVGDSAL